MTVIGSLDDLTYYDMLKPLDVNHIVDEFFTHLLVQRVKHYFDIMSGKPFLYGFDDPITRLPMTRAKYIDKNYPLGLC